MGLEGYQVRQIPGGVGRDFIRVHHYSHTCHNGPMCWGLFEPGGRMIGVIAFATPSSENVRASLFGVEHKDRVTELHRLVILDDSPQFAESYLISRGLKGLRRYRPHLWAVVSFADITEGHVGVIYQATNAIYTGTTGTRARFWRDREGRLRHPRQGGHNVTPQEAEEMGWKAERREAKHRYVFILPRGRQRRRLIELLKHESMPYPASCK